MRLRLTMTYVYVQRTREKKKKGDRVTFFSKMFEREFLRA